MCRKFFPEFTGEKIVKLVNI